MIFIWVKPGNFIENGNEELRFKIGSLITHMEDCVIEANVCLNMFEKEYHEKFANRDQTLEWERDSNLRRKAAETIAHKKGEILFHDRDAYEARRAEVEVQFLQDKVNSGLVLRAHKDKLVWIHARSFVFALDNFIRFIGSICALDDNPKLKEAKQDFLEVVPALRGVRNSLSHADERSQGIRRVRGEQHSIDLKPIDNALVKGTALVMSGLNGNRFGCTMEDGHYGEIEVSNEAVAAMLNSLQKTYDCFEWSMGPVVLPSR